MIGYFINMTLAASVAAASYSTKWWLPAIVFPAWIFLSRVTPLAPDKVNLTWIYAMRWWFYILATAYMIAQTIIFQIHVGTWFGWLIGLFIGWIVGGTMAGKLEPKLMHRGLH
jgi:hypothetical protein